MWHPSIFECPRLNSFCDHRCGLLLFITTTDCSGDLLESCSQYCLGRPVTGTHHSSSCNPRQIQSLPPHSDHIRSVIIHFLRFDLSPPEIARGSLETVSTCRMPVPLNECKCCLLINPAVWSDPHGWVPEPGVLYRWVAGQWSILFIHIWLCLEGCLVIDRVPQLLVRLIIWTCIEGTLCICNSVIRKPFWYSQYLIWLK